MKKWIAAASVIATISVTAMVSSLNTTTGQLSTVETLDSTTVLLDHKRMIAGDYIVLYSASPKVITSGSMVAKLPCDANSEPRDWVLIGGLRTDLTTFQPIRLNLIQGTPGSMCTFGTDITGESASTVSGIVLVNSSDRALRLPPTSSVVITVHSVSSQQVPLP